MGAYLVTGLRLDTYFGFAYMPWQGFVYRLLCHEMKQSFLQEFLLLFLQFIMHLACYSVL
jgi:hypothetical protein